MTCSICQHATEWNHCNPTLMGRADMVCWFCFLAWYECGLVTDEAIRQESIRSRQDETTLRYSA